MGATPVVGISDVTALLPVIILAAGGILILLLDALCPLRSKLIFAWMALAALASSFVMSVGRITAGMNAVIFSGAVRMDAYAHGFGALICMASILAVLSAPKYLRLREIHLAEYYALILFSVTGMILFAAAEELLTLFVALETLSVPVYALVAFNRRAASSAEASMKYFLLGAFATGFFVYGMVLLYGACGSGSLAALAGGAERAPGLFYTGMALLLVGFFFKIGAVPFHMWTPDAYEGAPTSVTTFMAEAVKAAPIGGLIKVLFAAFGFPDAVHAWLPVLIGISLLTMCVGNLVALVQEDIKRMLGYSSIAHSGYILLGIAAAAKLQSAEALTAVLYYLFIYVLMNAGAFGILILFSHKEKDTTTVDDLVGLAKERPWAAIVMSIFLLSLTGIPPLAGFFAKFRIFSFAVQAGLIIPVIIAVVNSVVSAYYYLKIIVAMYFRETGPDGRSPVFFFEGYSVFLLVMLFSAAAGVLYLGVFPDSVTDLARLSAGVFFRSAP